MATPVGSREQAAPFASAWRRAHLTVDERQARGLAARKQAASRGSPTTRR
jgi:hypothetical protein